MTEYSFRDNIESVRVVIVRLSNNPNLSEWERGFIKNVKEYYDGGGFLSDKQKQILSNLWGKY